MLNVDAVPFAVKCLSQLGSKPAALMIFFIFSLFLFHLATNTTVEFSIVSGIHLPI